MTTIRARIVADSLPPEDGPYESPRLTTFELTYPRSIHAEVMTYRVFARNASSSRAIPARKYRAAVQDDPYLPVFWGQNRRGMQAVQELTAGAQVQAEKLILELRDHALRVHKELEDLGVHKQDVNRYLEAWSNITILLTGTDFGNLFAQRAHGDAHPAIQVLAWCMWEQYRLSTPRVLGQTVMPGGSLKPHWHLPYVSDRERHELEDKVQAQCSAARCARVSYLNHDGTDPSVEKDVALCDRLLHGSGTITVVRPDGSLDEEPVRHMTPFEHQASPMPAGTPGDLSGCLRGWLQHRKLIPHENITDLPDLSLKDAPAFARPFLAGRLLGTGR